MHDPNRASSLEEFVGVLPDAKQEGYERDRHRHRAALPPRGGATDLEDFDKCGLVGEQTNKLMASVPKV
jgi:hypothetical protein